MRIAPYIILSKR